MVGTHFSTDIEEEYEPSEVLARAKAVLEADAPTSDDKTALPASTFLDDETGEDEFVYSQAELRAKAKAALLASTLKAEQPKNLPLLAFNTVITAGLNGKLESAFAEIARQRGLPAVSAAPVTAESSTPQVSSASDEKPEVVSPLPSIKAAALSSASIKTTTASSREVPGDAKPTVPKVEFNSESLLVSAGAAPSVAPSEATPLSPRHTQLLERQRQRRDQQCSMQEGLKRLREMQASGSDSHQPVAPKAPPGGPTGRRVVPGAAQSVTSSGATQVSAFRELREANTSLGAENRRLNEELARLMERSNNF